jgi:hypothetical protein
MLAAMLAISPATLRPQGISDDWQGTLHSGLDLGVVLHIEKNVPEKLFGDRS